MNFPHQHTAQSCERVFPTYLFSTSVFSLPFMLRIARQHYTILDGIWWLQFSILHYIIKGSPRMFGFSFKGKQDRKCLKNVSFLVECSREFFTKFSINSLHFRLQMMSEESPRVCVIVTNWLSDAIKTKFFMSRRKKNEKSIFGWMKETKSELRTCVMHHRKRCSNATNYQNLWM